MILVDAVYINQSGGKILLEYFIRNLLERGILKDFFFLLDSRIVSPVLTEINPKQQLQIVASERNRKRFYKTLNCDISVAFCFANVPPPLKIVNLEVFILFHNALILKNRNMYFSLQTQFKFFLKRLYIRRLNDVNYKWIVQTKNMSDLLSDRLRISKDVISIIPFYEENRFAGLNKNQANNRGNFLYVADGVRQKNHLKLLAAWEIVSKFSKENIVLHLTVPNEYLRLTEEIKRLQDDGVLIINHGRCSFDQLSKLYQICNYFITPSLAESFGLPLIESAEAGCEIVAADLEYVYDVVIPLATFDPRNEEDIAKKIILAYNSGQVNKTRLIVNNKIQNLIFLITNYV